MSSSQDIFGLEREVKIQKSGVRNVFTPHSPVSSAKLFFGRTKQVGSIIQQLNTPGQHSLLYGERGVGKSSLANIASQILFQNLIEGTLHYERCDSSTSFTSLLRKPLGEVGIDITIQQTDAKRSNEGSGEVKMAFVKGGGKETNELVEHRLGYGNQVTPSYAAEVLSVSEGLLVVDEADALGSGDDKRLLAEFIKQLSDRNAKFKVLIVGIAETGVELTSGHPSVSRCLRGTKLGRMPNSELELILKEGAEALGVRFTGPVAESIVSISAGYPHFTHLIALKCAENVIADDRQLITSADLKNALGQATEDAEGSLNRMYTDAVRSFNTDMYKQILCAAANLRSEEFTAEELREEIERVTGSSISQGSLNNYFQKLVSADSSKILRRLGRGVYKFSDPRMPSYVKIANVMF